MVRRDKYEIEPSRHEEGPVRDHMEVLRDLINDNPFLSLHGKLIEVEYTAAVTNEPIGHDLGFVPKDALLLSATNGATVTFNYDSFTSDRVDITVSAASRVRFIVGNFDEVLTA